MNKEFVKFILNEESYDCKEYNPAEMLILGFFLTDDVGCVRPNFKEWILDPRHEDTRSNFAALEKIGDHIVISDQFSELTDGGPYLKIHRDELIKILDAWTEFCKTKPKEIIITRESDTFTIEAKE